MDARKTAASIERIAANARDAVWYLYARKTFAIVERIGANARDAVWYRKACIGFADCILYKFSSVFIIQIAVYGFVILVVFINSDARKTAAIRERNIANARDAVGYLYARKTAAIRERPSVNDRDAVTYCYARKTTASVERIFVNDRDAVWNNYALKTVAIHERKATNARDLISVNIIWNKNVCISTASYSTDVTTSVVVRFISKSSAVFYSTT